MPEALNKVILSLDIGSKRIGLALWQPSTQWMQPLPRLDRKTLKVDLQVLEKLIAKHQIEAFLVGLPLSLSGKTTESTKNAIFWAEKLKETFNLPVYTHDEALSTTEALKRLEHKKPKDRNAQKDSMSALVILEEFIRERKLHLKPS